MPPEHALGNMALFVVRSAATSRCIRRTASSAEQRGNRLVVLRGRESVRSAQDRRGHHLHLGIRRQGLSEINGASSGISIHISMSSQPQIAIDKVAHVYRPPRGKPVLALEDISLEIRPREFVALLGPSGCGKSTLLYLIGGFLPIEKGTITVNGDPVKAPGPDRGIVFQHFALFPWKTVPDNILYGLERQDMPKARRGRSPSSISSASPASRTVFRRNCPAA
jgi:ABC-type multidrug transport system fused ATPase/permease subunit